MTEHGDGTDEPEELGGGPACDLHRVCETCGALEDGPPPPVCGRCGAVRSAGGSGRAPRDDEPALLTVGHGTLSQEALGALLTGAGVQRLVDVRRFPGSRAHPHVAADALAGWLPPLGVAYRSEPRLGGRRQLPRGTVSEDPWWTVEAFRAYAAHTRTAQFVDALDEVLAEAADGTVAVLCSEAVWWRCHRRLIADVGVLLHERPVRHLMPDGRTAPHRPSAGARRTAQGLVWDRPEGVLLAGGCSSLL